MTGLLSDIRFALRALAASRAFVVLAVLSLGIGIGASAMSFTVVNDVLLKPLGDVDPEGLVGVWAAHESAPNQWVSPSRPDFLDWEESVAGTGRLSALRASSFAVGARGADARVEGAYATGNLFAVLGVAPVLGRGLLEDDAAAGGEPVVVLGETFWRQQFGADRNVVGRTLPIDGTPHTVVGVMPALLDVGFPREFALARLWLPLRAEPGRLSRSDRSLFVIARLAEGVGVEGFSAHLADVASALAAIHPEDAGFSTRVAPLGGSNFSRGRPILLLSFAGASLLLLIACANVASLTLAHAVRRRHELGIRVAIGASPGRIARQLLCESLVIAALGTLLGLGIARAGLEVLVQAFVEDVLRPAVLPIDTRSLAFTIGLTFATTALFGLFPALEAARGSTRAQIAESGAGTTTAAARDRLRRGLVVGQVAASLVLLVGAALLSLSFMHLLALDSGIDTESTTSVRVESPEEPASPDDVVRFTERIIDVASALPGIDAAAATSHLLPMRGGGLRSVVETRDSGEDPGHGPVIAYTGATPNFFATLGIPLLRGRSLAPDDGRGGTAVVNVALARLLWPDQDPIGAQFRLAADPERGWVTVIGVSGDFLTWDSTRDEPLPTAYMDVASFDTFPLFFFIRKHDADRVVSAESITRAIDSLGFPLRRIVVTPMETVARAPFWRERMFSLWFGAFGIAALTLTAVGVYGVLAYLVWQRWREIGIRIALGADRRTVLLMVLRQGAALVAAGVAIGLAGAYVLARALRALLFGVDALDWQPFLAVTVFLASVALAAGIAPALRAARADPNALLRD